MSMFCFQCQETARNEGCTIAGVCGKKDDVANLQDLLVFRDCRCEYLYKAGIEPRSGQIHVQSVVCHHYQHQF